MSTKTKVGALLVGILAFSLVFSSCDSKAVLPSTQSKIMHTSSATSRSSAGSSPTFSTATTPVPVSPPQTATNPVTTQFNISLDIELPSLLETVQVITFKAKPSVPLAQIPQDTAWVWDFGDSTAPYTQIGRGENYLNAPHTYAKNGDYQIRLGLIDRTTKREYVSTVKKITINDSVSLQNTNHARIIVKLNGMVLGNGPGQGWAQQTFGDEFSNLAPTTFEWTGEWTGGWTGGWKGQDNYFTGALNFVSTKTEETIGKTAEGTVSITPEGITLKTCGCVYSLYYPNYEGSGKPWEIYSSVTLNDIPLTKISGGEYPKYYCSLQGKSVEPHVVQLISSESFPNGQENGWFYGWSDELPPIEIEITFDRLK
jgi:hypothetical protein